MDKLNNYDLVIVGAGACGLALAASLNLNGKNKRVLLLESAEIPGCKLAKTGNGRCNLANATWDSSYYHSLTRLTTEEKELFWQEFTHGQKEAVLPQILKFWREHGVILTEKDKWLYPRHLSAKQIRDNLWQQVTANKVELQCNSRVTEITEKAGGYVLTAVIADNTNDDAEREKTIYTRYLVLAGGGLSQCDANAPAGLYRILQQNFQVACHEILPGLVQLQCKPNYLRLIGLKVAAACTLILPDNVQISKIGEVLFTKYGVSGIVSLILSNYFVKWRYDHNLLSPNKKAPHTNCYDENSRHYLNIWEKKFITSNKAAGKNTASAKEKAYLLLDFCYDIAAADLSSLWQKIYSPQKSEAENLLTFTVGFLPTKLATVLVEQWLELQPFVTKTAPDDYTDYLYFLRHWPLKLTGTLSLQEAQVSLGGVDLHEIDPRTLALKKAKNCYVGGEMLDLAGDCGGYNLMTAVWTAMKIAQDVIHKL